jgi:hypothetical protein
VGDASAIRLCADPTLSAQKEGSFMLDNDRLHRRLTAELSAAGCFRPAPLRAAAYGACILAAYAAAYAALLSDPGLALRGLGCLAPRLPRGSRAEVRLEIAPGM